MKKSHFGLAIFALLVLGFFLTAQLQPPSGGGSSYVLPPPTATTLGGVKSIAAVSHQFLTTLSTAGAFTLAQPSCADLSNAGTGCSGAGYIPVTVLHTAGARSATTVGALALTNFVSGDVVVIFLDSEGATASEPTIAWSDGTTCTKAANGLFGGTNNASTQVCTLASSAPTVTPSWPGSSSFTGITAIDLPVSLVQAVIDVAASARNCCQTGNVTSGLALTTTVSDIVVSSLGTNLNTDVVVCPPNMVMAAGTRTTAQDSAYMCIGTVPIAVTALPVGMTYVNDANTAMQAVALKHQ